ncbi:annexin A7-like isoform X2 [Dreissena polymorpha]|uniref:DAZ-associated protein 2 n=2 Tax=Dreissena polymorpha TaxID=45954 RepID=A0A9D3YQ84_DREPO|nr:annexin A7-like [Dreissena polymorpha]XP_052254585.1 annexin A7-like isoform X2 [Dreissena polymorpha]XP_052254586.1 annexin A7-like isoform X2 [Dreissena polymorpha]KAH3703240.1 hypothetical protein DPMN_078271 [Dreissena polymorpha]KAH3703497.1 hypothetical protein DPMN_078534 [Dreissena polymorpha]
MGSSSSSCSKPNMSYPTQPGSYPKAPQAGYPQQGAYPGGSYPQNQYPSGYPYQQSPYDQPMAPPPYQEAPPPYAQSQQYPPSSSQYPPSSGMAPPPASYYPYQQMPQPQTVLAPGLFDSGARFDGISQQRVPPPPPGVMPNHAQMAAMQGHHVVGTQQSANWFSGGKNDGGMNFGW